jgi:hypothetical protein
MTTHGIVAVLFLVISIPEVLKSQESIRDLPHDTVAVIEARDLGNVSRKLADIYKTDSFVALGQWELLNENQNLFQLNVNRLLIAMRTQDKRSSTLIRISVDQSAIEIEKFLLRVLCVSPVLVDTGGIYNPYRRKPCQAMEIANVVRLAKSLSEMQ